MNQAREIPWQSILQNWRRKPRSIVFAVLSLPAWKNSSYLNIESMKLRKERIEWLLSLMINHDMQEIDEQFYELLPQENQFDASLDDSTNHPYDVDWSIYDSLQPTVKEEV